MATPDDVILTLNAGSSSLRFGLFCAGPKPETRLRGQIESIIPGHTPRWRIDPSPADAPPDLDGVDDPVTALGVLCGWLEARGDLQRVRAVGHRVVHGGDRAAPAPIDKLLLRELETLSPLAPLHQHQCLAAIRALRERLPDRLQVACFDTAFHHDLPPVARRLPIPDSAAGRSLRRYGFHGLSYASVRERLPRYAPDARKVIIAHLGSGSSLCALLDGRSVETSMGMTPLDGVPMATRSGSIDPGVLLWLLTHQGFDASSLGELLYRQSGLRGISGATGDMRTLLASADPGARAAVESFVYQTARTLAGLVVPLGGLDAVVFTGGIGEHAAAIRAGIIERCRWLGLTVDTAANAAHGPRISMKGATVSVWVIATDEEETIARETSRLLAKQSARSP